MLYEFTHKSLFLTDHQALDLFVEKFLENIKTLQDNWSIVCERKEDIKPVRAQIFQKIEKKLGTDLAVSCGLSFYSLDHLGAHFATVFSLNDQKSFAKIIPNFIYKDYIDVTTQEKIIDCLFALFGYTQKDSSPLSKQILSILDLKLPEDTTIFEVILESMGEKRITDTRDISNKAFKQILATFQSAKLQLDEYVRFQNLVDEFLNVNCFNLLEKKHAQEDEYNAFIYPKKFLDSHILWFAAPEYALQDKSYKSGNFLRHYTNDFFAFIEKYKKCFHPESLLIKSKCILATKELKDQKKNHTHFVYTENDFDFIQMSKKALAGTDHENFFFLGDCDFASFPHVHPLGYGKYSISQHMLDHWQKSQEQQDNIFEFKQAFNEKFDSFLDTCSFITLEKLCASVAKNYSLPFYEFTEQNLKNIFRAKVLDSDLTYKDDPDFSHLQKTLSYFYSETVPKKITIFGKAHSFVAPSFHVKLLNQTIQNLKNKGLDIELPANDKMYTVFWSHIQATFSEITFLLPNIDDTKKFPDILTKPSSIQSFFEKNIPPTLFQLENLFHSNERFQNYFSTLPLTKISVTDFESYVLCPFKYFLEKYLNLKAPELEELFANKPLESGEKIHKICEVLQTGLLTLFDNDGYIQNIPALFSCIIETLSPENIFLARNKEIWLKKLAFLNENIFNLLNEVIELIFKNSEHNLITQNLIQSELLKRCFLKFLKTEIDLCESGEKKRVGVAREYPFEMDLAGLKIKGRIDRIDENNNGYEIIDYKMSQVSEKINSVALTPNLFKKAKESKLSIQGGLYVLYWHRALNDKNIPSLSGNCLENTEEPSEKVAKFSLYRLKNINPADNSIISCDLNEFNYSEIIKIIEEELSLYAKNFLARKFYPNPLDGKNTCHMCSMKQICPYVKIEEQRTTQLDSDQ